ncbi:hypothetical protein F503_08062 [Ophiostoma piceae UAMH 11346]|uniref:Uncharacterized protein n=1 Tax=Ophiostoma piceae (strain UAMH 11346) TaxID=1262450 RepID=S3C699_OPHP1|nr:hypothetical protein F503_08062 [Ophiostoma piceae UAMH 11346]
MIAKPPTPSPQILLVQTAAFPQTPVVFLHRDHCLSRTASLFVSPLVELPPKRIDSKGFKSCYLGYAKGRLGGIARHGKQARHRMVVAHSSRTLRELGSKYRYIGPAARLPSIHAHPSNSITRHCLTLPRRPYSRSPGLVPPHFG